MSNVLNRITKQYLMSINTPDYPVSEWIINPVLPDCDKKWWVIEGDLIREMTDTEKVTFTYQMESTIYLIAEKQLLTIKDGRDYESNTNAIINPKMPGCELKYTKVVDGLVVEMTTSEKNEVDKPGKVTERNINVTDEIRQKYSEYDEMDLLRNCAFGDLSMSDQKMVDYKQAVTAAETNHPKIKAMKA